MTITITAFERSPDGGKGLARDTRVRWALEEVGQPYEVRLVSFRAMKQPAHLALHPFGQIPTYEEGDFALFETGAIVFHIAERHPGLLPDDANAVYTGKPSTGTTAPHRREAPSRSSSE
jgi:glutathione S-transferase